MPRIVQRIEIDCGHRLLQHEGKCKNVHGHRYVFELVIDAPALDHVGRVLDFGEVKRVIGGWLDQNLDHGFIAELRDPIIPWLLDNEQKCYALPCPPTAENVAFHCFQQLKTLMPPPAHLVGLRLWETPNCRAEVGDI